MTESLGHPCPCPMTAGQLLALGAIAQVSRVPGGPALSRACYDHARLHYTEPREEPEDAHLHQA